MAGLASSGVTRTALDVAAVAADCRHLDDVRHHLLPALARATGGHLAIYHQMSMPPDVQEFGIHWPDDPGVPAALANYPAVIAHSPLLQHFAATTQPGIVTVGDLLTRRQWHANPVYRESHRHLGIEDHLAVILGIRHRCIHGITIGRLTGQFGSAERTLVALLSPHLVAALRRCLASGLPYRVMRTIPALQSVSVTGPAVAPRDDGPTLTGREREVLALVHAGLLSTTIARRLDVSRRTVDKHLENVYRKLGVTSRFDAAAVLRDEAGRLGWLHGPMPSSSPVGDPTGLGPTGMPG